ncbi:MAG TPA: hypothetical protein VNN22_16400 [Verrucomicrobiae bacterium]|nr:hypothetical protein [Verrucomicrobiae bacterium]
MNVKNKVDPRNGSALLLALFLLVATSMMVGTYLYLVGTESKIAQRSLDWNTAIPAAEAGIEEALTQLYTGTNSSSFTTNSWVRGGDGLYHKNRTLASGESYGVAIQVGTIPVIWSTGYVAAPFGTNVYIRRLIKVTAVNLPSTGIGIITKGTIGFSGGAFLDSYSSCAGPYGTNNFGSNAVASSNSGIVGAISLSGGYIDGTASTGPNGTVKLSGSGTVNGTVRNDANVQIDDVLTPVLSSPLTSIPSGKVNGTNYLHVAGTGNYVVSTLADISDKTKGMVVNGNAVVYVTYTGGNAVVVSGSGFIYITPGSSLTLYCAGEMTISGGGVLNGSQSPSACSIYGLPTCDKITYSGSAAFIGTVYAPEADFTFSGGAGAFGSFLANTATISGSAGVHADTCLGGIPGYVVQSWNELPAQ